MVKFINCGALNEKFGLSKEVHAQQKAVRVLLIYLELGFSTVDYKK